MQYWKRNIQTLTREQIDNAVADPDWQRFRSNLKGLTTADKLDRLDRLLKQSGDKETSIRVDNYINALLRGGQLRRICANIIIVAK